MLAARISEALDLDLERPGDIAETDIAFVGIVAALSVIETFDRTTFRPLGREVKARRKHLLHEQAGGDRCEGIVDGLCNRFLRGIGLCDQVGNPVVPREWFLVPLATIDDAVEKIKDGTVADYIYDPKEARLKRRDSL